MGWMERDKEGVNKAHNGAQMKRNDWRNATQRNENIKFKGECMAPIDDVIYTLPAEWRRKRGRTKTAASPSCMFLQHNSCVCFITTRRSEGLQDGRRTSRWIIGVALDYCTSQDPAVVWTTGRYYHDIIFSLFIGVFRCLAHERLKVNVSQSNASQDVKGRTDCTKGC